MLTRLVLAAFCFLFALHEYFGGKLEGAQTSGEGLVTAVLSGEPAGGPVILTGVGAFLVYRAWEIGRDRRSHYQRARGK